MKQVLLSFSLVLLMAVMLNAQDRSDKRVNFYLGAGVSVPMGDLGDGWNLGFHGSGAFGFAVAPGFQILGKVEYQSFGIDKQGLDGIKGGTFSALMFGPAARYAFETPGQNVAPFIIGGFGMANAAVSDLTVDDFVFEFESETKLYFEFGGGVDIAGESVTFFLEGKYVSVSTEGSAATFIPLTIGLRF